MKPVSPQVAKLAICLLSLFILFKCDGQSIEFVNKNLAQTDSLGKASGKIIFIDVYADWCAPCRQMETNVFTDKTIAAYYNNHFINAKFNIDKEGKSELKRYFPINGYPCFIFTDASGKELHRSYGYRDPQKFLSLAGEALTPSLRKPQVIDPHQPASEELSLKDVALIREMYHLQANTGYLVWQHWQPAAAVPLLYKTKKYDYLFDHPNPPEDFTQVYNIYWKGMVYMRKNTDSLSYQATSPVNGVETMVISAPEKGDNPCVWELKACHELFHIYQYSNKIKLRSPFTGRYASYNELNFPFNYGDEAVLASCRVEAEYDFDLLRLMKLDNNNKAVARRVFKDIFKIQRRVFADTLQAGYKQWMEWNEGVARYTEREMALHVINGKTYRPTADFARYFKTSYSSPEIKNMYTNMLNPVRFVGEGVRGTVMFYYLGMGKACLLDLLNKDWKMDYFEKNLDELILAGK